MRFAEIEAVTDAAAREHGLTVIGACAAVRDEDGFDDAAATRGAERAAFKAVRTILMIAPAKAGFWSVFGASREAMDGHADPLDRWTRRIGDTLAASVEGVALYPFGEPAWPFMDWARRSRRAWPSPIGMHVDAERGLWVNYRLAIGLPIALDKERDGHRRPCDDCFSRPCVTACPVGAFENCAYTVEACVAHLESAAGATCMRKGCLSRRACPVGRSDAPSDAQASHHMRAFLGQAGGAVRDNVVIMETPFRRRKA